jgi:DNA polymerase/3'-5' exonuclease PolX
MNYRAYIITVRVKTPEGCRPRIREHRTLAIGKSKGYGKKAEEEFLSHIRKSYEEETKIPLKFRVSSESYSVFGISVEEGYFDRETDDADTGHTDSPGEES